MLLARRVGARVLRGGPRLALAARLAAGLGTLALLAAPTVWAGLPAVTGQGGVASRRARQLSQAACRRDPHERAHREWGISVPQVPTVASVSDVVQLRLDLVDTAA